MKRLVLITALAACASAETAGAPGDAAVGGRVDAAPRADAAIDAFVTPGDAPPANNTCAAALTCATAQSLGTVSGDTGAGMLTTSGHTSAWFRVRVTEDYSDAPGLALRMAATLTLPASGGFETFVYVNPTTDTVECNTTTGTVSTIGNAKEVRAEWGEGFIPNGGDDTRDVTIEVRAVAGTSCSASNTWQLRIDGNWL